ncbi:heterokaryon incompatibility protein-domain-containing protein, partial [Stachybotrys elegans]
SDDSHVRWMKSMLKKCTRHHHKQAADGFVPKRLVDVSCNPPRLVLGDSLVSTRNTRSGVRLRIPKYSALSYCWGENGSRTQLKTTNESLPSRLAGIKEDDMSAVLRDAVLVTRLLSIDYLWIDSLCILQVESGSANQDWEEQCQDMAIIYQNAYATLQAGASKHCNESFL